MKTFEIINALESGIDSAFINSDFSGLNTLLNQLKADYKIESLKSVKGLSFVTRQKKALSFLKSGYSKINPILSKAIILDNKQYFTNAFVAFEMVSSEHFDIEEPRQDEKYPDIKKLMVYPSMTAESTINYNLLSDNVKLKNDIVTIKFQYNQEKRYLLINPKLLKNAIDILGLKNTKIDVIIATERLDSPMVWLTNEAGSKAMILPISPKDISIDNCPCINIEEVQR